MTAIDDFISDATQRMDKSVEATHEHFNSVRTGRASAALLDRIQIDYYGTPSPLKNIATISANATRNGARDRPDSCGKSELTTARRTAASSGNAE